MSCSTELFGDVLHPRLDRGEVFVDPARFAADPEKAKRFPELPYVTLRLAYLACDHFNADTGLAIVRPDHQAFYRRVFLHETIAEPRAFPGWHTMKTVIDGVRFPDAPGKGLGAFSHYAIERFRAADVVRAPATPAPGFVAAGARFGAAHVPAC